MFTPQMPAKTIFARVCAAVLMLLCATRAEARSEGFPEAFDFHDVRAGDVVNRRLAIRNEDEKPFALKVVNASCSCMRILGFSKQVEPGQVGFVLMEFRPARPGRFDLELLVETDRERDPVVGFHWVGEIAATDDTGMSPANAGSDEIVLRPEVVASMKSDPNLMLVDIRDPGDFNLYHVDGSINWQVGALKALGSLKTRRIVLIGKGSDDESVVRDVLALRVAGFENAHVLQGGLRAWAQLRLPVRGSGVGTVRLATVTAVEFFAARQDEWLLVDFRSGEGGPSDAIPGSVRIAPDSDWAGALRRLIEAQAKARGTAFRVLVVSDSGERYETVERQLPAKLPAPVFYLDGGMRAYRLFAAQQIAFLNRRESRLSNGVHAARGGGGTAVLDVTGCSTCPKKGGLK